MQRDESHRHTRRSRAASHIENCWIGSWKLGCWRTQAAKVQIENLVSSLELYRIDAGRLPTAVEGLKALVERPATVQVWNGPYLKKSGVPLDPWGRPYVYLSPGRGSEGYELRSLGRDGTEGGTGEDADLGGNLSPKAR